ncbi:hypothetical protein IQ244_27820 [Nostoc sp. LEGE 06077]|uniref:hypothetical protein n=1 Tax=Nostoc sp. LEGE 06077 TaxID=915325 RepID=UPI0018827D51|nr:hypothetical protein [Nostoc sp. LEGE 06077]MBE9210238.1 hypothetical protein [Nostoc sp. LEGE 06077]
MEIILPQFNIEEAINSAWQANQAKAEIINGDRQKAEETAINALTGQFKKELDTYLDSGIQSSLKIKIVPPTEILVFSVYAVFDYSGQEIKLKRDSQNWEIGINEKSMVMPADLLRQTLLLELGKLKNEI